MLLLLFFLCAVLNIIPYIGIDSLHFSRYLTMMSTLGVILEPKPTNNNICFNWFLIVQIIDASQPIIFLKVLVHIPEIFLVILIAGFLFEF
jgi:hypothetical protein